MRILLVEQPHGNVVGLGDGPDAIAPPHPHRGHLHDGVDREEVLLAPPVVLVPPPEKGVAARPLHGHHDAVAGPDLAGADNNQIRRAVAMLALLIGLAALAHASRYVAFRVWIIYAAEVMRDMVAETFAQVQRYSSEWHANNFAGSTVPGFVTITDPVGFQDAGLLGFSLDISRGGALHIIFSADYLLSDEYDMWSASGRLLWQF